VLELIELMPRESSARSVPAAFLAPSAARERRRVGQGLLAFGIVGLVLLALSGLLVLGSLGALASAAAELDTQRARLMELLPPTAQALDDIADSASNAGTSLEASARATRNGANLVEQLAQAMDGMSAAAQLEVLGVRPFGGLADELANVATRSRSLAADLESTAGALDTNVSDSRAAAADLRALADELATLRTRLASDAVQAARAGAAERAASTETAIALARLVLLGLLLWLAVPASLATWLGWRWSRG
jgi:hypothetical protein